MPVMSLRDAIAESIKIAPNSYGSEAFVTLCMHDAEGPVLYGKATDIRRRPSPSRDDRDHRRRKQFDRNRKLVRETAYSRLYESEQPIRLWAGGLLLVEPEV